MSTIYKKTKKSEPGGHQNLPWTNPLPNFQTSSSGRFSCLSLAHAHPHTHTYPEKNLSFIGIDTKRKLPRCQSHDRRNFSNSNSLSKTTVGKPLPSNSRIDESVQCQGLDTCTSTESNPYHHTYELDDHRYLFMKLLLEITVKIRIMEYILSNILCKILIDDRVGCSFTHKCQI